MTSTSDAFAYGKAKIYSQDYWPLVCGSIQNGNLWVGFSLAPVAGKKRRNTFHRCRCVPFSSISRQEFDSMHVLTLTEELLLACPREIRLLLRCALRRARLLQSDLVAIHGQCIYQEAPLLSTAKKNSKESGQQNNKKRGTERKLPSNGGLKLNHLFLLKEKYLEWSI